MTSHGAVSAAVLAVALLGVNAVPAAAQCAMCKTVLTGSSEGQAVAGELNHAILVMLVAPYLVFGTLAAVLFRKRLGQQLSRLRARARAGS